jgi:hypothetical protein
VSSLSLGGPGPACSVTLLRRLAAGEIEGALRVRAEQHLAGCARCQKTRAELEEEARALVAALPFDRFAAGVAERLAEVKRRAPRSRPLRSYLPLALAAALAVGVAVPLVARIAGEGRGDGLRVKGGPSLALYAEARGGARLLAPGEKVPKGASLRLALGPAGFGQVAVLVLDEDGPAILYAGAARSGPLPGAFEWTGRGRGLVIAVLSNAPIDTANLLARVSKEGARGASARGTEVVTLTLERGATP